MLAIVKRIRRLEALRGIRLRASQPIKPPPAPVLTDDPRTAAKQYAEYLNWRRPERTRAVAQDRPSITDAQAVAAYQRLIARDDDDSTVANGGPS